VDEDEITSTGAWYTPFLPVDDGGIDEGSTLSVAYCCQVTPFIVFNLNVNENTPPRSIVDDTNEDETFEIPGIRPRCDDDSSDDGYASKRMGHRNKRKGLFNAKALMLEEKGDTFTEFVEI
jgi:hypothetical protein